VPLAVDGYAFRRRIGLLHDRHWSPGGGMALEHMLEPARLSSATP
jgi:hypothetical protein